MTFSWDVPKNAPSGTWSFSADCRSGKHDETGTVQVRLHYAGSGHGQLVAAANEVVGGGKGGGNESCQPIEQGGTGQACFSNDPFASYQGGTDVGQCTWYAAGMRPDLDGITTGRAAYWLSEAQGHRPEGTTPEVGAIAVDKNADGGVGHVAYVAGVENGGATLVLDEANIHNKGGVFLNIVTPASEFQGYIYGGPAAAPTTTSAPPATTPSAAVPSTPVPSTPAAPSIPAGTYAETTGSVSHTWTNYQSAGGTQGPDIAADQTVGITCRVQGYTVADGNTWWYQVASSPWSNQYYVSADAFYNNGSTSGSLSSTPFYDQKVALCPADTAGSTTSGATATTSTPVATAPTPTTSTPTTTTTTTATTPPPAPTTWAETVGSVAHTWTDYQNGGGTEGPAIAAYQTVQIACRVQGLPVSDGNTWWYRIASSPWNNQYYVSADAFYNNGHTSGSLIGTPLYDSAVATC